MRASTFGGFDASSLGEALARPGMDPRQWLSYGVVEQTSDDNGNADPVAFTTEFGPLVNVVLQPSGVPVPCRVLGQVAGNGEGEYFPFMPGDEVLVAVPEGDERAGCVILGRLNNEIDAWPAQVGGADATKNNFAFRRLRTPYLLETASSYMLRSATTGAFLSISADGRITISNADSAFFTMNPDIIGMQSGDGSVLLQLDLHDLIVTMEASGSKFTVGKDVVVASGGNVYVGTNGGSTVQHGVTMEQVVNLLNSLVLAIGATVPGPVTGAALAGVAPAVVNAALVLAAAGTVAPFTAGITAALSAYTGDPTAQKPGAGLPGLLLG